MKHFLSILLRNQFNLLYRFGCTYIPKCQLLEFKGVISEATRQDLLKMFSETTPFEWDEEYLIIHFDKNELPTAELYLFQIQDIVEVYPLSDHAKTSIETKIDIRIKLENPVFESILPLVEQRIEKYEFREATQALWCICNIEDDLNKYITNIGLENIFNGLERRKKGTKPNQILSGNYWEYVIAYDRFDYFPNSILGYFYDAGQIFANTKGLPSFEGSELHKFLQSIKSSKPDIRIKDIVKLLENEEQGKKYVSQTTVNEQLQYIITPLYLMLKDEIRKADDIRNTNLFKHLKTLKEFGCSFNYAIILLGAFFGFKKFYDVYYDHLNLRFYKSYKPVQQNKSGDKIIASEKRPFHEERLLIVDKPKPQEITLKKGQYMSEDNPEIEQQLLSNAYNKYNDIKELSEPNVPDGQRTSEDQRLTFLNLRENSGEFEPQEKTKTKNVSVAMLTEVEKQELSEYPIDYQNTSTSETETEIMLKKNINELLRANTEMKLTDMGDRIKELIGQKFTNTIIKNVIKSMANVEIVPKKKPETARKITLQELFNEEV